MTETPYPFTWEQLSPEDDATVKRHFGEQGNCRNIIRSDPELIRVSHSFKDHCERVRNIEVRKDDIWIVTHPKCGTTLTQEMVWHLVTGVDLDTAQIPLYDRSPFIDMLMIRSQTPEEVDEFFRKLASMSSPRIIKTHYPFELLPPNLIDSCKVIFVCRSVKDVVVSYYHHEALMKSHDLLCDFVTYAREIYRPGLCLHGGYFEMLESGWKRRKHPNLMFFWYEEFKADRRKIILEVCKFLNLHLTKEQIDRADKFLEFDTMQSMSSSNKKVPNWKEGKGQFIRKGIVGDWKNHFTPELAEEYDTWIEQELDRLQIEDTRIRSYYNIGCEV